MRLPKMPWTNGKEVEEKVKKADEAAERLDKISMTAEAYRIATLIVASTRKGP